MKRILITGSRTFWNRSMIREALRAYAEPGNVLVHGCARGADRIAAEEWVALGMPAESIEHHPANWESYGKRAGRARNGEMASKGAWVCLAFTMPCRDRQFCSRRTPHITHGTAHMLKKVEEYGITVEQYPKPT